MRIKRPDKHYRVEYASDVSRMFYAVQFVAECLTIESAINACKDAVQIHGWDSGVMFIDLVETSTNGMIDRTEIEVADLEFADLKEK